MPAPDRLQELLRQRALLQEHLAWLDREIAETSGGAKPAAPFVPVAPVAVALAPKPVAAPTPAPAYVASPSAAVLARSAPAPAAPMDEVIPVADEILEQYRVEPNSLQSDVKKGCLLYFIGAFALFALGVVALYFFFERGK